MLLIVSIILIAHIFLATKHPKTAIVTSIISSIMCVIIALERHESDYVQLVSLLIFPVTLITLLVLWLTGKSVDETSGENRAKTAFLWSVKVFGALILFVGMLSMFNFIGFIFWTILISSIVGLQVTLKRTITYYIISTIRTSMRQNLPLPMALDAAAGSGIKKRDRILKNISKWLIQGQPLSEALRLGHPKCPADILATITAAEKIGQLPEAIKNIEAEIIAKNNRDRRNKSYDLVYPITVLTVAFLILMGLMIFIIPVFGEVLADLGDGEAPLPGPTQFLMDFSNFLLDRKGLLIISPLIIGIPLFCFLRYLYRRSGKLTAMYKFGDFVKWHLPVMNWFELSSSLTRVIGFLRVSLNAGCPVDESIEGAMSLDINNCFRQRLGDWLERIKNGENISEAARQSRLGNAITWAFDQDVNRGNTIPILEMLENHYREHYHFKAVLVGQIAEPITILLLGLIVGFVVYAMFLPMIELLYVTMGEVAP